MSLHCPDWIFDAATASVAFEFLSSDLPIETFASKYSEGLAEYYVAIDADEYYKGASLLLEFLSEVEVGEDAAKILQDYRYFRLYFEKLGLPRKMKTMFGTVEDGVKVAEASVEKNLKAFRAYTFRWRSKTAEFAPLGWSPEADENLPNFAKVSAVQKSLIDLL